VKTEWFDLGSKRSIQVDVMVDDEMGAIYSYVVEFNHAHGGEIHAENYVTIGNGPRG